MQRAVDDRLVVREANLLRPTRLGPIDDYPGHAIDFVAIEPTVHGRARDPEPLSDRIASRAIGRGQDDMGALHDALGGGACAGQALQAAPITAPQRDNTNGVQHGMARHNMNDTSATLH